MLRKRIHNLKFSKKEWWLFVLVAFVTGVILSWRMWGESSFNVNAGLENLVIMFVASFIAIVIHFGGEKLYALKKGYEVQYVINHIGLGIGAFVAVLFDGFGFILAPGYMEVKSVKKLRIGKWKYRPYFRDYGYMAFHGIIANLILAAILSFFIGNPIVEKIIRANILIAFFSLIPAPKYDGFHILFASFYQYAFIVGFVSVFAVTLMYYASIWIALISGIVIGFIGFITLFYKRDYKS